MATEPRTPMGPRRGHPPRPDECDHRKQKAPAAWSADEAEDVDGVGRTVEDDLAVA
jgi:hypothetical protein